MHDGSSQTRADATGLRIAIVTARYHEEITSSLRTAAADTFAAAGGSPAALIQIDAPGAYELPVLVAALAEDPAIHAVVALGCVVRGETSHDHHINAAVAQGLMHIAIATGKPVAFGVITCESYAQAEARAGGPKGNKGVEAMNAAIETVNQLRSSVDVNRS